MIKEKGVDLSTTPLLYIETVNGVKYLSQVDSSQLSLLRNIQDNPEITVELNTQVDDGVLIGSFPIDA